MLTPYQFASNRPIDGIDLDGLEYLRADEAKVQIWGGRAFIKLENFSQYYQTEFRKKYRYYGLTKRQEDGTLSGQGELGQIFRPELLKSKTISLTKDGIAANYGTIELEPRTAKSTGLRDRRFKPNVMKSSSAYGVGRLAGIAFIINAVNFSVEYRLNSIINEDLNQLARQTRDQVKYDEGSLINPFDDKTIYFEAPLNMALQDIELAKKEIIPKKYLTDIEALSTIVNIVLYGGDGDEPEELMEIGNRIINEISKPNIEKYNADQKIFEEKY
jgi:hypothetical protein